jgi:4-oxalomesaconate hydratase
MAGSMVVISAHSVDFVWRAGGTIAKYAELGWDVNILVLSLGVRGESASLWKQPGQTAEAVGEVRRSESSEAAAILGCTPHYFDLEDYRMTITREVIDGMVGKLREFRPSIILTHAPEDPFNPDHPLVYQATVEARLLAGAAGVTPETKPIAPSRLYGFEPHQPEMSNFKPEILVDISGQMEKKLAAMKRIPTQAYLADFHLHLAEARGYHARRNGSNGAIQYAEAFQSYVPIVVDLLP